MPASSRLDWVDTAKGICIAFVVMMHATLGVEAAMGVRGWMHHLVEFAAPARMPAFFLLAGLFLSATIDRDWRSYLDKKVLHFAWFYLLWVTIQLTLKTCAGGCGPMDVPFGVLRSLVEPFGTLWFIWMLPVFFVVTKLLRRVPPLALFAGAVALEIAPVATGSFAVDEFAARYVYFVTGYLAAPLVFDLAAAVKARPSRALVALVAWAAITAGFVWHGSATSPFVSLLLGFAGAAAVVALAVLMSRSRLFDLVGLFGRQSIVIYLAFFLPMAVARAVLVKSGLIADVGTVSLLVWLAAIAGALLMHAVTMRIGLTFLWQRPAWAHLPKAATAKPAAA
jgi:uncharacterized membrane protein YcfT